MRNRKHLLWNRFILFLCLCLLSGCRRVPEPKTLLLPEEETEQGVALQGEEGDRYAVRKIYGEDYASLMYGGFTAFLQGTGEHQVRLAEGSTDGLMVRNLDYRYGFYDTEIFPVGELVAGLGLILLWDYPDLQKLETEFFSPDGRYLLYMRGDMTYTGMQLYLLDLETGEEALLLDGDAAQCPGDQFMILAAWSPDASMLCYGFYPRNVDVWDSYKGDKFILYYCDMERWEIVNRLNYYYAGTTGKKTDLQGTRLYVDRDGKDILTAIVSERGFGENNASMEDSGQVRIDFFPQEIPEPGRETEGVVMPHVANCSGDAKLFLDAAGGFLYFTSQEKGILSLDVTDGAYVSTMALEPERVIRDFCVLDGGEAFVTAEYDRDYIGDKGEIDPQDICLYTMTEEGMTRRVLYQNAGYVIRLQYDPVYRRLLAETGVPCRIEEASPITNSRIQWEENRRALVLEF